MKTYKKLLISGLVAITLFAFAGNTKAATLSQTSVSVAAGQTSTVYAYNVISSLYISNNSNTNVATVYVSGNSINIYGVAYGSTTVTVCDSSSGCNVIYISVTGNGNSGTLSLSQSSLSLSVGQTSTVTAYNSYNNNYNYGSLYISNNSNSSVATATINGSNVVSIYASSTGSTTITVCQNYNSVSCGYLYVTVNGYNNGYNNGTGLNISNITLSVGSSATISPSNSNSYYNNYNTTGFYVSSNSNPNVASATASSLIPGCYAGSLYSITTGQLCSGNNYYNTTSSNYYIPGCYAGTLYSITTGQPCSGNNYYNNTTSSNYYIPGCYAGSLYSITTGQLCSSSINGGGGSIVITAVSAGSDTITLCQSGGGSTCNTINVTVAGYATPYNSSYYYNSNNVLDNNSSTSTGGIPVVYSTSSANN